MTTRYEGADAKDTRITIIPAGGEIGVDVVPEGQVALCFNYDEVFYLQGTPREVRRVLTDASMKLPAQRQSDHYAEALAKSIADTHRDHWMQGLGFVRITAEGQTVVITDGEERVTLNISTTSVEERE